MNKFKINIPHFYYLEYVENEKKCIWISIFENPEF